MRIPKAILFTITGLLAALPAWAAELAGTVKISKGEVTVERDNRQMAAPVGTRIFSSDRVMTGADSSVGITLRDNTLLSAGPHS